MPIARTWPAWIAAIEDGNAVKAIGVWPPTVDCTAGAAPEKGTWIMSSL